MASIGFLYNFVRESAGFRLPKICPTVTRAWGNWMDIFISSDLNDSTAFDNSMLLSSIWGLSIARKQVLSILKGSRRGLSQKSNTRGWRRLYNPSALSFPAKTSWDTTFLLDILLLVIARDLSNSLLPSSPASFWGVMFSRAPNPSLAPSPARAPFGVGEKCSVFLTLAFSTSVSTSNSLVPLGVGKKCSCFFSLAPGTLSAMAWTVLPSPAFPPSKLVMNPINSYPRGVQHLGNGVISSTFLKFSMNCLQKLTNSGSLSLRSTSSSFTVASSHALDDSTLVLNISGPKILAKRL